MNSLELFQMIKEEVDKAFESVAGTPTSLHGSEESQRAWVMKFAEKNGGIISNSMVADALGITRAQLHHTGYMRRVAKDLTNRPDPDFHKIIDEVPFERGAVFQLIGTPPLSKEEIAQIASEEEKLFGKTEGVNYPVFLKQENLPFLTWLNLPKGENIQDYYNMIPAELRSSYYINPKPQKMRKTNPDKVVTKDEWQNYINTQISENKR